METEGEKCARCGDVGEDRRTLWMACLYDMSELKVPFEQLLIRGTVHEKVGEKELQFGPPVPEEERHRYPVHRIPVYSEAPKYEKANDYPFFKLKVCKGCRADWMAAIKHWFNEEPAPGAGCGSGIWVREHGVTKEISEREWLARRSQGK